MIGYFSFERQSSVVILEWKSFLSSSTTGRTPCRYDGRYRTIKHEAEATIMLYHFKD